MLVGELENKERVSGRDNADAQLGHAFGPLDRNPIIGFIGQCSLLRVCDYRCRADKVFGISVEMVYRVVSQIL